MDNGEVLFVVRHPMSLKPLWEMRFREDELAGQDLPEVGSRMMIKYKGQSARYYVSSKIDARENGNGITYGLRIIDDYGQFLVPVE
jgi:hypothetical protein